MVSILEAKLMTVQLHKDPVINSIIIGECDGGVGGRGKDAMLELGLKIMIQSYSFFNTRLHMHFDFLVCSIARFFIPIFRCIRCDKSSGGLIAIGLVVPLILMSCIFQAVFSSTASVRKRETRREQYNS